MGTVTTFTSLRTLQNHQWRQDTRSQHPAPRPLIFLNTTNLISVLATISTHAQIEARTRGPWLAPPKLVGRQGLHIPHAWLHARSWLRRGELALRRRERDNPPHPMWPLIPTFKQFINHHHHFPSHPVIPYLFQQLKHPPDLQAFKLSMAKHIHSNILIFGQHFNPMDIRKDTGTGNRFLMQLVGYSNPSKDIWNRMQYYSGENICGK